MTIQQPAPMTPADDAELARAAACGNQSAFAAIYDRYADRLCDFCVGMLHDRDAAADCVQDVFVTAATRLAQLREPDRLRSWLYAIARNEALTRIRERRREQPSEQLPEIPSGEPDLATLAARNELAELISEACGGLSDRDRVVLELAYRQGLDGYELAEALGVSHTNANTLVGRLRDNIERSLGALLVSRRVKADPDGCPELAALLDSWDGRFTVLVRKRVARHIEGCAVCDDDRRRMVSPVALLGGVPVFVPAPLWLREQTLTHVSTIVAHPAAPPVPPAAQTSSGNGIAAGPPQSAGADPSWWPPPAIDTTDLGDAGPATAPHTGTAPNLFSPHQPAGPSESPPTQAHEPSAAEPAQLPPNQVLYHVPHVGSGPLTPARSLDAGGATRHVGSLIRMALVVALLLVALGGGFLLGPRLIYRVWPAVAPGGPMTSAPTPTTTTAGSIPANHTATTTPGPAPTIPTGQTAPATPPPQPPPTTVPAAPTPTDHTAPATPPAHPPPTIAPGTQAPTPVAPAAVPRPTAQTAPPASTTVPAPQTPPGGAPIPRRSAIGGSNGACPPVCSPNNGIK